MARSKQHTVYKTSDGKRVPGVTTIIGVLNKPALVKWANNLGLQGIDSTKYVDTLADAGTLAHEMIMTHYTGKELELEDYSEYQIDLAHNAFQSFLAWEKNYDIEPLLSETPITSDVRKFGGTPDLLANVNGVTTLLDFKTGKALYPEHDIQAAAYSILVKEYGFEVEEIYILRIGREADEGFEIRPVIKVEQNVELFLLCQQVYELQKELKRK